MPDHTHAEATLEVEGRVAFAQIPQWVLRSAGALPSGAVHLYGVIMSYADNATRVAFPGKERLAADMGVSVSSVGRSIKALEGYGALTVIRARNPGTGNFRSNRYVLHFNQPQSPRSEPCVTSDTRPSVTSDTVTRPMLPRPSSSTSDKSERSLHPDAGASGATKPDPISQEFRQSPERARLLDLVQEWATIYSTSKDVAARLDADEAFVCMLTDTFQESEALDHLVWDQGWTPPAKATGRYEAAVWLNKFLNEWINNGAALRY